MKRELGPLPETDWLLYVPGAHGTDWLTSKDGYEADQMHAYATQEVAAAVAPLEAEMERLRAAIALAANRMDVLALDHDYGITRRNIADDWAKETRAAMERT